MCNAKCWNHPFFILQQSLATAIRIRASLCQAGQLETPGQESSHPCLKGSWCTAGRELRGRCWGQRKSCPKLQRVAVLSDDCQHYACLQQTCFAQDKEQPSESPQTLELVAGTWHPASALALRASTDRTQWERSWDWPGCGQDAAGMCLGCVWGQLGCRAAVIHPCLCSTHRFPWKSTMGRRNVW